MANNAIDEIRRLKIVLREETCPYFSDDELLFYLEENGHDFDQTVRNCLIVKSEDTTLSVSGLSCADTSKYFRRLAQKYRKSGSQILKGG